MPSTLIHAFLPAACAYSLRRRSSLLQSTHWWRLVLLAAILGNAPDLDLIPASLMLDRWQTIHRFWGHNLFSVIGFSWIGAWAIRKWVCKALSFFQAFLLASALVWSHLFLDALHDYNESGIIRGVPLFWPFSNLEYHLPLRVFQSLHLRKELHFFVAHVVSKDFWQNAIFYEILAGLVLFTLWNLSLILGLRLLRRPSAKPRSSVVLQNHLRGNVSRGSHDSPSRMAS